MKEKKVFHDHVKNRNKLTLAIHDFDSYEGGVGDRNTIKILNIDGVNVNIKAFKIPNIFNQIAYRFFRKSKAERSFEYAKKLIELGIGTPKPLAFFEYNTLLLFKKSFYLSEQQDCDLTYRELITDLNYPNHETILRAFTRFTYLLHEKGVQFLDHSPGNTLIKKNGDNYDFYLVDLNRMNFGKLDFETRIKNFSRLTMYKSMVEIMSDEYAKCTGEDRQLIFNLMWKSTLLFQKKYQNRMRLKKKLKFWKKNANA
ncbi:lipopolysaccharide kinase InaA family protein [Gaetbulibacter aquiaggeris]|uniref:Lipopolysaccharide kinase InaA family protein n=1 Tax=Gaetbulibacter aquiaggeris TaxID=1735373 RepID=A0ABW7MNU8_9FLAO